MDISTTEPEIDILGFSNEPLFEIGSIFCDSIGNRYKYCGLQISEGCGLLYRWVPFEYWTVLGVET